MILISIDGILTDKALSFIKAVSPDFVFLYMVETDQKGGHDRDHGSDSPEDMTIPILFHGKEFEAKKNLTV